MAPGSRMPPSGTVSVWSLILTLTGAASTVALVTRRRPRRAAIVFSSRRSIDRSRVPDDDRRRDIEGAGGDGDRGVHVVRRAEVEARPIDGARREARQRRLERRRRLRHRFVGRDRPARRRRPHRRIERLPGRSRVGRRGRDGGRRIRLGRPPGVAEQQHARHRGQHREDKRRDESARGGGHGADRRRDVNAGGNEELAAFDGYDPRDGRPRRVPRGAPRSCRTSDSSPRTPIARRTGTTRRPTSRRDCRAR